MRTKRFAKLLTISGVLFGLATIPGLADAAQCHHVGGGVLTNFLQPGDCVGSSQNLCTDGTSTGDLRGSVGVSILGVNGNVFHVHHHWVTESGDTIFLNDANLTTFPTSDPNRVLGDYLDGVKITGGTGAFDGANGTVFAFGAADLKLGQITLRYSGMVCFQSASEN